MRQLIYAVTGLIVLMAGHAQANMMPEYQDVKTVYVEGRTDENTPCSLYAKVVNGHVLHLLVQTEFRVVCSGNHHAASCKDVRNTDPIIIKNDFVKNMIFHDFGNRAVIRGSIDLRSQYDVKKNPGPEEASDWPRPKKLLRVDFQNGLKNGFYFSFAASGTSKFDQEIRVWCKK